MIKVIEHGTLKEKCSNCRAKLQFSVEDIITEKRPGGARYIICPDCGAKIPIKPEKKVAEPSDDDLNLDDL